MFVFVLIFIFISSIFYFTFTNIFFIASGEYQSSSKQSKYLLETEEVGHSQETPHRDKRLSIHEIY